MASVSNYEVNKKVVKIQSMFRKLKSSALTEVLKQKELERTHNLRGVLTDFSLNLGVGTVTVNTTGEKLFVHRSYFVNTKDIHDVFQKRTLLQFDASSNPRNLEQRQAHSIKRVISKDLEHLDNAHQPNMGTVESLNTAKRSGTLVFEFNAIRFRIFFHINNIRYKSTQEDISEGDCVMFDVQTNLDGTKYYASNIRIV